MRKMPWIPGVLAVVVGLLVSCHDGELSGSPSDVDQDIIDVAETSGQLASGTSFRISGSSSDSTISGNPRGHHHGHRYKGILDGVSLLAPTDELLAIVDAESASDFRGLRISRNGGATITHYNAEGEEVSLALPREGGPNGCSFSGKQFPEYDSLLSAIVKTVIDFGSGVTFKRDTITITRSGKIIITRSGDSPNRTEVTTFENYVVNGIQIEGTKTRVSTYDAATGSGTSTTTVSDGKLTYSDGSTATWKTERLRTSAITIDETTGRAVSGEISTDVNTSVTASDGTVIYAHKTAVPLVENIACRRRFAPVSGTLETTYRDDIVVIDFGDGSCDNQTITITVNGVTTTKTIGR